MSERVYNVLFLCRFNSARSQMAEALLRYWGKGRFCAFSAGSQPAAEIHPETLETLRRGGIPHDDLRPKSWEEFAAADAPVMDFIFTVCEGVTHDDCPTLPGHQAMAHWAFDDPAAFSGTHVEQAVVFNRVFKELQRRVQIFAELPFSSLSKLAVQREIDALSRAPVTQAS